MDEIERKKLLIKAKTYKMFAGFFTIIGLVVFFMIYINNIENQLLESLKKPETVIMIIVPFIPALFLTWKYKSMFKKIDKS